eukprot:1246721-Pleurochrysis_carterae.AAC.1
MGYNSAPSASSCSTVRSVAMPMSVDRRRRSFTETNATTSTKDTATERLSSDKSATACGSISLSDIPLERAKKPNSVTLSPCSAVGVGSGATALRADRKNGI